MDVDKLLEGNFSDDEISSRKKPGKGKAKAEPVAPASEDDDEEEEDDDLADLPDAEAAHINTLQGLATKDPEFYKYLQEHDADLLNFGLESDGEDEDEQEEEQPKSKKRKRSDEEDEEQVLTLSTVRNWQRSILKANFSPLFFTRSLKSLRSLLQAFRSASLPTNTTTTQPSLYTIQSPVVYSKVLRTSLAYTPVVLSTHYPPKTHASGKVTVKQNAHTSKIAKSYFSSLLSLWPTLSDADLKRFAVVKGGEMAPWLGGGRNKREWIRLLVDAWSQEGEDEVKVVALVAIRKMLSSSEGKAREEILSAIYTAFVSKCKKTNVHTLPHINLMKNSAAELFTMTEGGMEGDTYQLAYGYIRQIALVLRQAIQGKHKDVYTWQIAHSIDFWSIVISLASDKAQRNPSKLSELLYPLVQVGMGIMKLVPTSRYHPFRLHVLHSFLRLVQRTGTFIPLAPFIISVLSSPEISSGKNSTLKPLPFNFIVKAPQQYSKTRVYGDGLLEEGTYFLAEYLAALSPNVAFPELVIPILITLRKALKKTRNPKYTASIKPLVEKIEANVKVVEEKRREVEFSPSDRAELVRWKREEEAEKTPLGVWVKTLRKQRRRREEILEKAAREGGADVDAMEEE
ncbi:Noc2-domain-containing protein [Atractiella rhizophila]|nr:Noc2-domain-containing protein [Atractiella rhizophila]